MRHLRRRLRSLLARVLWWACLVEDAGTWQCYVVRWWAEPSWGRLWRSRSSGGAGVAAAEIAALERDLGRAWLLKDHPAVVVWRGQVAGTLAHVKAVHPKRKPGEVGAIVKYRKGRGL